MELKNITLGILFTIFIGAIVALAILPEIATQQGIMTTKSTVTNETIDITPAWVDGVNSSVTFTVEEEPSGWKITSCPITGFTLANSTVYFTETTDYSIATSTGVLTLVPTAEINSSGNTTYASYQWCRDGYVVEGSTRNFAGLITLFAALGLIAIIIYFVFGRK